MKRYIKVQNWYGTVTIKRMVNQPEIVDYITNNPGQTESQIMFFIYGFSRGGLESNKKYADCLRRALYSGKISRKTVKINNRNMFIYFKSEPTLTKSFMGWINANKG